MEPRPNKYRQSTQRQENVENSKSRQWGPAYLLKDDKQLVLSSLKKQKKISDTSHSMCSVETSQLFREEKLFL